MTRPRFCVSSDLEQRVRGAQRAGVADLSAGLGVERRAVEDHFALLARRECLDTLGIPQQRHDAAL